MPVRAKGEGLRVVLQRPRLTSHKRLPLHPRHRRGRRRASTGPKEVLSLEKRAAGGGPEAEAGGTAARQGLARAEAMGRVGRDRRDDEDDDDEDRRTVDSDGPRPMTPRYGYLPRLQFYRSLQKFKLQEASQSRRRQRARGAHRLRRPRKPDDGGGDDDNDGRALLPT